MSLTSSAVRRSGNTVLPAFHFLLIATLCVALSGCAATTSEESTMEDTLETQLADSLDAASGVYVRTSSSGFANTEVAVRLYLDDVTEPTLSDAVRSAFETTWHSWTPEPVGISVEVVDGPKPAEPKRVDGSVIDITSAARALDVPGDDSYQIIHFNVQQLTCRFGESGN